MHATLSSLALGLVAVAGLTQATMIPNSVLGFVVPKAGAAQIASRDDTTPSTGIDVEVITNAGKFDRHVIIANAEELSAAAPAAKRDESRAYVKRTMIPNAELGFTLPAAEKRDVQAGTINVKVIPNAGKFDRHTVIANVEELSAGPETTKREEVEAARPYEKRTMVPNSVLGFVLPSEAKLASRSAAWARVAKA